MWLIKASLKNPYMVATIVFMILVLGVLAIVAIPKDILPVFKAPAVQIITYYPGMPAETVENIVDFALVNADTIDVRMSPVDVATAKHDVIGNKRFLQLGDSEQDFVFPLVESEPLDSRNAEEIFNNVTFAIREIAELEWEEHAFQNKC